MPVFEFLIKEPDFFINVPGVSVTEVFKSKTKIDDGEFFILNKGNNPIYFIDVELVSVRLRRNNRIPNLNMGMVKLGSYVTNNKIYYEYDITFRNNSIGNLKLYRPQSFEANSKKSLFPFEAFKLNAVYNVQNINVLPLHYYGENLIEKNKMIGTIDFNFNFNFYEDKNFDNIITDYVTVSVNLINSGYVPQVISEINEFESKIELENI